MGSPHGLEVEGEKRLLPAGLPGRGAWESRVRGMGGWMLWGCPPLGQVGNVQVRCGAGSGPTGPGPGGGRGWRWGCYQPSGDMKTVGPRTRGPAEVTRGGSPVGRAVWQCGRKGSWPAADRNRGGVSPRWRRWTGEPARGRARAGSPSPHLPVPEASTPDRPPRGGGLHSPHIRAPSSPAPLPSARAWVSLRPRALP